MAPPEKRSKPETDTADHSQALREHLLLSLAEWKNRGGAGGNPGTPPSTSLRRKRSRQPETVRSVWVLSCSVDSDSATPWTVDRQAPLSMGFSRQESWSWLLYPSPGDLPDLGIETGCPALQADSLQSEPPGYIHTHTHTHTHGWRFAAEGRVQAWPGSEGLREPWCQCLLPSNLDSARCGRNLPRALLAPEGQPWATAQGGGRRGVPWLCPKTCHTTVFQQNQHALYSWIYVPSNIHLIGVELP